MQLLMIHIYFEMINTIVLANLSITVYNIALLLIFTMQHIRLYVLIWHSLKKHLFKCFSQFYFYWVTYLSYSRFRHFYTFGKQHLYQIHVLKVFSPYLWLAFLFFNCVFWRARVFDLDKDQLLIFLLWSHLKTPDLTKGYKDFSPRFSSRSFIILAFTDNSVFQIELILWY